jgi:SAM-dependent methyltransferase
MIKFYQARYWIERHRRLQQDPRSVGNLAATLEANIKGEMVWRQVAGAVAEMLPIGSVLDIGCGYGRVAQQFIINGHRYTGIDVSPEAIARAESEHPTGKFICCDVLQWHPRQQYDIVAALYVFVHFVDDNAWRSIVEKSLAWLAPNGVLVMADAFVEARQRPGQHVVARPLQEYAEIFAGQGYRFDEAAHAQLVERLPGLSSTRHVRFVRRA